MDTIISAPALEYVAKLFTSFCLHETKNLPSVKSGTDEEYSNIKDEKCVSMENKGFQLFITSLRALPEISRLPLGEISRVDDRQGDVPGPCKCS